MLSLVSAKLPVPPSSLSHKLKKKKTFSLSLKSSSIFGLKIRDKFVKIKFLLSFYTIFNFVISNFNTRYDIFAELLNYRLIKLAALAQMVACLPLVTQVRGSILDGVVNFHLKIFNLRARRGGDVHFLIARLHITGLD